MQIIVCIVICLIAFSNAADTVILSRLVIPQTNGTWSVSSYNNGPLWYFNGCPSGICFQTDFDSLTSNVSSGMVIYNLSFSIPPESALQKIIVRFSKDSSGAEFRDSKIGIIYQSDNTTITTQPLSVSNIQNQTAWNLVEYPLNNQNSLWNTNWTISTLSDQTFGFYYETTRVSDFGTNSYVRISSILVSIYYDPPAGITTSLESDGVSVSPSPSKESNTTIIVGVVAGALVLILICIVGALWISCRKDRSPAQDAEKSPSNYDHTALTASPSKYQIRSGTDSVLIIETSVKKDLSNDSLKVSKKVLQVPEVKDLQILEKLGGGNFGEVYRGIAWGTTQVAVKKLKDKQQMDDVIAEAYVFTRIKHPSCVYFLGIHRAEGQSFIVTEFLPNGSLDVFLQKHQEELSLTHLIKMAIDAASGVHYLHTQSIIHRDLSARNLLGTEFYFSDSYVTVDADCKVKVGDFGMSKILERTDFYQSSDVKLPVKWSSPEALEFKKFTTASDSWSFGVVLWEIITKGRAPYPGMSNNEVIQAVIEENYRMEKPKDCPDQIYSIMTQCWNVNPEKRPTMKQVVESLQNFYLKELEPDYVFSPAYNDDLKNQEDPVNYQ